MHYHFKVFIIIFILPSFTYSTPRKWVAQALAYQTSLPKRSPRNLQTCPPRMDKLCEPSNPSKFCFPGPLTIGTSDDTSVILATNGCTPRLTIDAEGAVTIAEPTSGTALNIAGNTTNSAVVATGNSTTTAPALTLINNPLLSSTDFLLTIDSSGVVKESTIPISSLFIINGCQPGPLNIGTSDATPLTLATNGCISRMTIDSAGAVTIAIPTSGTALSVIGNTGNPALEVTGNSTTTAPALQLIGNPASANTDFLLTIDSSGAVKESTLPISSLFLVNSCQPGPLNIGTSDATSLILGTNGCISRLTIDSAGAVSIATPTSGTALSITGNTSNPALEVTGNSTTTAPALTLIGNPSSAMNDFLLTINAAGVVRESVLPISDVFIINGCQSGPLNIGTSNATSLLLATNGCITRMTIDSAGAVTIATPTSGVALSVTGNTSNPALEATGNSTTTAPALTLIGNPSSTMNDFLLTINAAGVVRESTTPISDLFIINDCQPGPLNIGTSDATSLILATNGCITRMSIDSAGAVSIATPTSGVALSVTGNTSNPALEVTGNSTTTAPALQLIGNPSSSTSDFLLTINAAGVVRESVLPISSLFLTTTCQPGPLTIGTSDATSLTLATNGCTSRLIIDSDGAVTIATPTSGVALSITGNTSNPALEVTGNSTTTAPALQLIGNPSSLTSDFLLSIDAAGVVRESVLPISDLFIINGCQPGPLTIGTSDATSLILATSGCTSRLIIDSNGAVTIETPTVGTGLTINGGGETINSGDLNVLTGNIILPQANAAGTQGLLELGGTGSTNVVLYEIGVRNFFAGNGAVDALVTGSDNISIGTSANNTLTVASNTIAIGNTAQSTGTNSISIGNSANSIFPRTIVIGSKDSTSTGLAPTAGAANAIAIGSASGVQPGATATGVASIAVGGSGGTFSGASASGDRSIALGVNAASSAALSIAVGSASGTVGGSGPSAINTNTIAIGSGNNANPGPTASGINAIAVGSAGGSFPGAAAAGNRSIAIGTNAISSADLSIAIGCASGTAGGTGPISSNTNAIAIGSGDLGQPGALASGLSAIAIGGSELSGTFPGAIASGNRSIALGVGTTASSDLSIAIGSSSSGVGGFGASATTGVNAIAIGSGAGTVAGASATGIASIAIGSASSGVVGASALADRSVAIGNGATTSQADAIILGNSTVTGVRVGIGINSPSAKLHVVGAAGTPVLRMDSGSTAITSAPVWTNPATSAVAGTPIHYNASNQLFGFTSSYHYKTNIRPMDSFKSEVLYKLTPVLYDPKEGYGEGHDIPGFIAEDVYNVDPLLVILNNENKPENVAYNYLHALIIKEIQKQQDIIEQQAALIALQGDLLNQLSVKIAQLTSLQN